MRHKSSIKTDRMQKLFYLLKGGKVFSTAEIARTTKSVAVHSDISDLRLAAKKSGYKIFCEYFGMSRAGRKIFVYQMVR